MGKQAEQDALKAAAWDMQRIAKRHVDELRRLGKNDLADQIEHLARATQAIAEEHADELGARPSDKEDDEENGGAA